MNIKTKEWKSEESFIESAYSSYDAVFWLISIWFCLYLIVTNVCSQYESLQVRGINAIKQAKSQKKRERDIESNAKMEITG